MGASASADQGCEVFGEELERELARSNNGGLWDTFKASYNDLVAAVVRPPRIAFAAGAEPRADFAVLNGRGLRVQVSAWGPLGADRCALVYVAEASRLEALPLLPAALAAGFAVAAVECAGAGASDGEHVSLGFHESHDVADVLRALAERHGVRQVALWGRSSGAAAALLHAKRVAAAVDVAVAFGPGPAGPGPGLALAEAAGAVFVQAAADERVRAGDVVVSVDGVDVRGRGLAAVAALVEAGPCTVVFERPRAAPRPRRRRLSLGASSPPPPAPRPPAGPRLVALVLDSPFSTFYDIVHDLAATARADGLPLPRVVVSAALELLRGSVRRAAGFDVKALRPVDCAPAVALPAAFVAGDGDELLRAARVQEVADAYAGEVAGVWRVPGGHDARRPPEVLEELVGFVAGCRGVVVCPGDAPPVDLMSVAFSFDALGGVSGSSAGCDGPAAAGAGFVSVEVTGYERVASEGGGTHVAYTVEVVRLVEGWSSDGSDGSEDGEGDGDGHLERYVVQRRFHDFKALFKALERVSGAITPRIAELRSRLAFSSRFAEARLRERQQVLGEALQVLAREPASAEAEELVEFLSRGSGASGGSGGSGSSGSSG